ncbi:hypothetical protein F5Y10DRAFT_260532 [Nemania abortiva]|nr:hypothetical protein F5Y10DRAFT_260532 [Nemania abortiva]
MPDEFNLAELGRVAQAAIRSTSLLRAAPIRLQPCRSLALASPISGRNHMSTTSGLRSPNEPAKKPFHWANPSRDARGSIDTIADIDIRKPKSSSYDIAFGGKNSKGTENEKDEESVEFASDFQIDLDIADVQPNRQSKFEAPKAQRPQLRLVPRLGRTVQVRKNVDVARSFNILAGQVAKNGVRRDFYSQRFHERPGKKRKRLKSERWQRRFKQGFKATISRVRELTAQGW